MLTRTQPGPVLWLDVEDLFLYASALARPTGIQRLAFELCRALVMHAGGPERRVRFVRHSLRGFRAVGWQELLAVWEIITAPVLPRPQPERVLPQKPSLRRVVMLQQEVLRQLGRAATGPFRRGLKPELEVADFTAAIAPGDVLMVPGSPWLPRYAERLDRLRQRHGLRAAMLAYDMLPLRHPEWCNPVLRQEFKAWTDGVLPLMDTVFAISAATATDVEAYAAETGLALRGRVRPVAIGSGFSPAAVAGAPAVKGLPPPGSYVLMVSTIEPRKNHLLLFRVWQRLLKAMDPAAVPDLVFAGRAGWMVEDFMQMLENTGNLGGRIILLPQLDDRALAALYRGCLFTVYPSFYEGWGLPVTESLAFGRPCIISNATSLPEAGGHLARYFDPEDTGAATRLIADTLADRSGLAAWTEQVTREFVPVSWAQTAASVLDGLELAL